ncbi:hypothetical protein CRG98_021640 [Punica granatum]|uniref:Uncharacterized protein n=1 Tax=Punica granatum TaxID=22663 RepID=A0A2I0JNU9_PUNGR|nr:hypothetical protein CRG98_021640 [Punica granatum]
MRCMRCMDFKANVVIRIDSKSSKIQCNFKKQALSQYSTALRVRVTVALESTDLGDDLVETISLGLEIIELGLDSHIWGGKCPRLSANFDLWKVSGILVYWRTPSIKAKDIFLRSLEILFLMGRMLGEVQTLGDHCSPCGQDL